MSLLRVISAVIFSCLLSFPVTAIEFQSTTSAYTPTVIKLLETQVFPVIEQLPEDQRRILDRVVLRVDDLHSSAMAISLPGITPEIVISSGFIESLSVYTEAFLIGEQQENPHFSESFLNEYFWWKHPGFRDGIAYTPMAWSGYSPKEPQLFYAKKKALLDAVLLDVIFHEMGHHVTHSFYDYRASVLTKQAQEQKADQWATSVLEQHFPKSIPMGRLVSIGLIFERDRWSWLANDHFYPRVLPWVTDNLSDICEDAIENKIRRFCRTLEDDIGVYLSSDAEEAYRLRIDNNDHFANYPLAQILLDRGHFVDACMHFKESLTDGDVTRAAVYVGWCYQNGYLQPDAPDAQVLALAQYRQAAGYGYLDAKYHLRSMYLNKPLQDTQ